MSATPASLEMRSLTVLKLRSVSKMWVTSLMRSMKANFDIELAIDILTMSDRLDVVVLMSGDGDFRRLVELIASRGVRVEIVAFAEAVSTELKAVADLYIDIGAHLDDFKALK